MLHVTRRKNDLQLKQRKKEVTDDEQHNELLKKQAETRDVNYLRFFEITKYLLLRTLEEYQNVSNNSDKIKTK